MAPESTDRLVAPCSWGGLFWKPPTARCLRGAGSHVLRTSSGTAPRPPAAGGGRLDSASPRDIAGALGKGEGLLGSPRPHAQAFLQMRVRPQASGAMPAGTGGRGGRRTCEAGPGRPMQERSMCPGPQPWGQQARPDPSAGLSPAEPLWARPSIPTLTRPAGCWGLNGTAAPTQPTSEARRGAWEAAHCRLSGVAGPGWAAEDPAAVGGHFARNAHWLRRS